MANVAHPEGSDPVLAGEAQFGFAHEPRLLASSRLFGVTPRTAYVEVEGDMLHARFGPWVVRTPTANVADVSVTGPFRAWKIAGPARLSLSDLGLTFGTATSAGACIRFREPVRGIDPLGLVRHPALTVTVERPEALQHVLGASADASAPTRDSLRQRLTRGALHGLAATAVMSVPMLALQRLEHDERTPPRVIVDHFLPARLLPDGMMRCAAACAHAVYGAAGGALFGAFIGPRSARRSVRHGLELAAGLLLVSYEGWVPAAGILPRWHRQGAVRATNLLVSHVVYGTTLGRLERSLLPSERRSRTSG
ncbi:MAG TPA: hypothetical protein VH914_05045 [Acidimicrobiia bacterium]|jgi:hypothetical protein|nr:hypothetical protein [Acidimicrobiia bacterium]